MTLSRRTQAADTLPELRARVGATQEDVSRRLGLAQSSVSRLERRGDLLVSTLRKLVRALGGELELVARFPSERVRIALGGPETDGVEARLRRYFASDAPRGLVSAYLFGSVAEGREHRESDVDVGVLLDRGHHASAADRSDARVDLGSALIHVLGRNDVDVVVLNDAPPALARRIVVGGRRLACRDREVEHAFVRDVQLRAADLAPFLARMRRIKLQALRS